MQYTYENPYAYCKEVWERHGFSDETHGGEDEPFAVAAGKLFRLRHFRDVRGICLHILHGGNSSRCFPQIAVPRWTLEWMFPAAMQDYIES